MRVCPHCREHFTKSERGWCHDCDRERKRLDRVAFPGTRPTRQRWSEREDSVILTNLPIDMMAERLERSRLAVIKRRQRLKLAHRELICLQD